MNDLDRIAEAARSAGCHEPSDLEPAEGISTNENDRKPF